MNTNTLPENKYKSGMSLKDFEKIASISTGNRNFYLGLDKDLLLCISYDDNLTDWFLLVDKEFVYIGDSIASQGDMLNREKF